MTYLFHLLWQGLSFLAGLVAVGGLLYLWLKRTSDDRNVLVTKWIVTAVLFGLTVIIAPWLLRGGGPVAAFLAIWAAFLGLCLAVLWLPNVINTLAKPLTDLYTGGETEPDQRVLVSVAEARRKRGLYQEAIAEIEKELEQFPTDFAGQMLLAEIQADNLKDLAAAQNTVQRLLEQPGHNPKNIALALNRLADWHLALAHQPEAARQILEQIPQLYPDTEEAYLASQRIAHLNPRRIEERRQAPRRITLVHHAENLGLQEGFTGLRAPPEDFEAQAAAYIEQLEKHPADSEARENLALLYARQFKRLDLAVDQLEQMIAQPGAPAPQVARWLNLLADLQISLAGNGAAARQTLERILHLYPTSPHAEKATKRIAYLAVELKGQQSGGTVKLEHYEQNLGLSADDNWGRKRGNLGQREDR